MKEGTKGMNLQETVGNPINFGKNPNYLMNPNLYVRIIFLS